MKELDLIEKVKWQLNFRRAIIVAAFLVYTIASITLAYTLHTKFHVNMFTCLATLAAALALAGLYFWRKRKVFKPLKFIHVAQLLDTSLDTKDRFVTLASFERTRNPGRNRDSHPDADENQQAAVAVITSQITPYIQQFSLAKHLPWRMDYSDRTLLCLSPLSLIALISLYAYTPERSQPMTMAEKQIVRELKEMAQDSHTISPVLHSELLDLANSIEQAGLLDSGTEQQIDSTIEIVQNDIQKFESRDSADDSQEGNEKQEQEQNNNTSTKETRSESGKEQKSSQEDKQSQDNKTDEGKTDDNKKDSKEVSSDEKKDDQKGDLNPQGKTQEQDRQGSSDGSHEQQQKTNKSSTQESQSEQAKKDQKNKDTKQGGSGNDNQDQNSGSEEAEKKKDAQKKPGNDNGATGLGNGSNSENSEQGEPSGDGSSQTAGDQSPKSDKQPKSSQNSSQGGTSAGTDIDGKTPGSFKKEGSDTTAKLKDIKDKLEDIKDSLKNQTPDKQKSGENTGVPDNSDGKADGKTGNKQDSKQDNKQNDKQGSNKDDKKTDGAAKADSEQNGEKSENQNPDKSAAKSKLSKQDPSKGQGNDQTNDNANDKLEQNDADQPSNEGEDDKQELDKTDQTHKRDDLAPESQKGVEGEEANATAANRNTKSDRPLRQPKPSEDAQRYGAGDGESASLSQTKTEVQVGIQNNTQKIAIRGLGSEDKKLYRNPKEAKEKIGIENQEFTKPKVDYSKQKQPIPVEYQGWLE